MVDLNLEDHVVIHAAKTRTGFVPNKPGKVNQDQFFVIKDFTNIKNLWFMGVCDGHGVNGHKVSEHVKKMLPINMEYLDTLLLQEAKKGKFSKSKLQLKTLKNVSNSSNSNSHMKES